MPSVPPRIARQRTIAFSSVFSIALGAAFFQLIYFIPIWFQAILDDDAWHSGVHSIPLILSMTVGVILSGGLTTKFGHYMPFVLLCVLLTSVGSGLITTFSPTGTSTGRWIGYQILFGFGCGLAFQVPQIAAQAVLPLRDVPIGVSITFFAETLGGAIFVPAGASLLDNRLVSGIASLRIPGIIPEELVRLGATEIRSNVPEAFLDPVVQVYNDALVKAFQLALIMACLTSLGAAGMEWRSVHNPIEKEIDPEEQARLDGADGVRAEKGTHAPQSHELEEQK
jgi:MFS family permease